MSTITLVMYSSTSTIAFLRTRVRVLKKYSYSSTSTSTRVRLLHLWHVYDIYLQHVSVTIVCVMGELFAKVNFQKYVLVRQFFHNIEQFSHDMYDMYH